MRVGWFQGDAREQDEPDGVPYMARSQDEIFELAEWGDDRTPTLRVLLIPDGAPLSEVRGDDFNDIPASANAHAPLSYPDGSRWVELRLGDPWPEAPQ